MCIAYQSCAQAPSVASKRSRGTPLVRVKGGNPLQGLGTESLAEFEAEPQ